MKKLKSRKGFSLVEMVAVVVILAIVTIGTVLVSQSISTMRTQSRNSIYLTTHNLNVMEDLRAEMEELGETGELMASYPENVYSTEDISTVVTIDVSNWDNFKVYNVKIESRMKKFPQKVTNTFIMTNIGMPRPIFPEDGGAI